MKCIPCAACTTNCPSFWADENFVGPAAIVTAHRFIVESRDDAADERLEILNDREGVWRCRTIFNCTEACPREIRITKAIGEVKKAILKGSAVAEPIRHAATSSAEGRLTARDTICPAAMTAVGPVVGSRADPSLNL
jgi:succinate dehydrogenase / fumarate reductase iron-sulfur subunit